MKKINVLVKPVGLDEWGFETDLARGQFTKTK